MTLGNFTGVDKVWVPFVVAALALAAHYGLVSSEQVGFFQDNIVVLGAMVVQAIAVFATTNKS